MTKRIGPELPNLRGDPNATKQVISNLLENAQKHAPSSPIAIHVDAVALRGKPAVRIEIANRGAGIAPSICLTSSSLSTAARARAADRCRAAAWASRWSNDSSSSRGEPFRSVRTGERSHVHRLSSGSMMDHAMRRILVVEDDPGLQLTLGDRLAREGYAVEIAKTGEEGLDFAKKDPFDLVLLDVMLPKMSGFDVCVALRQSGVDVPVLMLTARGALTDRLAGLKLGADDYLVKPFEMAELLARIEARFRRMSMRPPAHLRVFGDVRVDSRSSNVEREGKPVNLSAKEYRLLCYFLEHEGMLLSREELLERVWGYDPATTSRTVDVHVAGLRRKLEQSPHRPAHFLTVHGLGYKFVA